MAKTRKAEKLNIYVMERGFVLVGEPIEEASDWLFTVLKNCAVIRRWGTTNGLGQLAEEGPLKNTILEPEADGTKIRRTAVYREIPCNVNSWNKKKW